MITPGIGQAGPLLCSRSRRAAASQHPSTLARRETMQLLGRGRVVPGCGNVQIALGIGAAEALLRHGVRLRIMVGRKRRCRAHTGPRMHGGGVRGVEQGSDATAASCLSLTPYPHSRILPLSAARTTCGPEGWGLNPHGVGRRESYGLIKARRARLRPTGCWGCFLLSYDPFWPSD
jgi:hypothetical protein